MEVGEVLLRLDQEIRYVSARWKRTGDLLEFHYLQGLEYARSLFK